MILVDPVTSQNRTQIVVSTNEDSGEGSLRQTLEKTQSVNYGYSDINFNSKGKNPDHDLTTCYFTIELKKSSP